MPYKVNRRVLYGMLSDDCFIEDDVVLMLQNILIKKEPEGRMSAIVADFGLAAKIPNPL